MLSVHRRKRVLYAIEVTEILFTGFIGLFYRFKG